MVDSETTRRRTAAMVPDDAAGIHVLVSGHVQGVGFRYFAKQAADALGVAGWTRNLRDGLVEVVLVGPDDAVHAVLDRLGRGPRGARVDQLTTRITLPDERAGARRPLEIRTTV